MPVKFAAGNEVKFAPLPENEVAVNCPLDELKCNLFVFTFGALFPTPVLAKIGKQSVSVVSLDTVIVVAVVAVPVIVALKLEPPASTFKPPELTLIPFLAVINPTESILVTSSYVNVPPMVTLPEKFPFTEDKLPLIFAPVAVIIPVFPS